MTVCIVARSSNALYLISDRMITSGDVQFEPTTPKIIFISNAIAVMYSGDAAFHAEVIQEVMKEANDSIAKQPLSWLRVKDVVTMYVKYRNLAKLARAEAAILAPLNLDRNSFTEKQRIMDPALVQRISSELVNFEIPDVTVIIAGLDQNLGPLSTHIHSIHNEYISDDTGTGFRAIGSGARHAESLMMLARHAWDSETSETVLRVYCAKKNAEIAPGVGAETDMFMIGPELGQSTRIQPPTMKKLDEVFQSLRSEQSRVQESANSEMRKYVDTLVQENATAQQPSTSVTEKEEKKV